jgi:uncharacterized protein (TIGR02271 family)
MTDSPAHPPIPDTGLAPTGSPADDHHVEVIRSEEQLSVATVRVPYRRLRIGKRVVTETRTVSVEVRREELVYYEVGLTDQITPTGTSPMGGASAEMILHEEQIVVNRIVVPVERVRVAVDRVDAAVEVTAPVSHEEINLDRG